jgi:omega-6 fatty acid desaturase (delta-12 desaturase)
MAGTSDLQLPPLLNWFSADIGCHSIHHLCEAIPNYRLQDAHRRNAHLLTDVKRLRLSDIPSCFAYILWDDRAGILTSVEAQAAS